MTEVKKTIAINVPTKLVDKETHEGKEYVKLSTGETKTPVLRGVTLNLGTADAPKWGKISVRDTAIRPMTKFGTKEEIAGMSTIFLDPVDYTFTTREKTGNQIEGKDGQMVNEWVNKTEKINGADIKEAMKAARSEYVHTSEGKDDKGAKTVWVSIPAKLVDEKTHEGKEYVKLSTGETKTPVLRAVTLNLGTTEEPKWGTISVRDSSIKDAKNFKTGEKIADVKTFPLDPTVDYTFTTREKTGKQIEDKDGKMVNEWVNKTEKISGADIAGALKAGREAYKHSINDLESKKAEVAAPTAEAPKKAIEDLGK